MTVSNISNSISAPQPIGASGESAAAIQQPAPVEQIAITDPYELTLSVLAFIASTPVSSSEAPAPDVTSIKGGDSDSPKIDLAA